MTSPDPIIITRRKLLKNGLYSGVALSAGLIAPPAFATFQITPYIAGTQETPVDEWTDEPPPEKPREPVHKTVPQATTDIHKTLSFYQTHTGETLKATFFKAEGYDKEALRKINHILRDHRSGDIKPIDPALLELLFTVKTRFEINEPFHIISGYRSPATNAWLAKNSTGVDKKSFHMQGKAIDIRVPGIRTAALYDLGKKLKRGGAGYYPPSDFVHLDTGPVRVW